MATEKIKDLLQKQQSGQLNDEEKAILDTWYLKLSQTETAEVDKNDMTNRLDAVWAGLQVNKKSPAKIYSLWRRIAAAASILLILSAGGYLALRKLQQPVQIAQTQIQDIEPGHNQATLTLANGRKIVLTKGLTGQLATQGATVIQANDNNISYNAEKNSARISYNTLATARGEQSPYPLVLADGTKVWLNAASSITFPTAFPGKERIVKITGEAYFEVAHNNKQSFKVESAGQVTEDIGTHFNIMAYADEPVSKVTLAEGSVKVNGRLLKPGEQTINANGLIKIAPANVGFELAWKDGYFRFTGSPITSVMRELARWYNIEVVYQGEISADGYYGTISRYKNISQALHMLSYSNQVHFKVEGRRIIVTE